MRERQSVPVSEQLQKYIPDAVADHGSGSPQVVGLTSMIYKKKLEEDNSQRDSNVVGRRTICTP